MTADASVRDKEERAEACPGHFLVCAEPGDCGHPHTTRAHSSLGVGICMRSGKQQHGHGRATQSLKMTAVRVPQICTGFQDADSLVCDCEEFGSS